MLMPLVNFSSSFRFRVRQSCAAVSLRLSQSKPACTRLSACRRHSCLPAAYHRLPLPAAGCPSRRAPLVLVPVLLPLACSAAECCHHICYFFSARGAQRVESPGACSNRAMLRQQAHGAAVKVIIDKSLREMSLMEQDTVENVS